MASENGLTTIEIGIITAAYPAGLLLAAGPAGLAVARWGSRRVVSIGLWSIAAASAGFAFGTGIVVLSFARLVQGMGACAAWAGVLSWLAAATPAERRGEALGSTYSAAFTGMLLGPVLGAIATAVGRTGVFIPAAIALAAVAVWGGPALPRSSKSPKAAPERAARASVGAPQILRPLGVMLVLGLATGGLNSLAPLLLAGHGASSARIAAAFLAAATPPIVLGPRVGRLIDRRGPGGFIAAAYVAAAVLFAAIPVPRDPWILGAVVSSTALTLYAALGPISLAVTRAADRDRLGQGVAMAMSTASWGAGAAIGALTLTSIAHATSDAAALAICSCAC